MSRPREWDRRGNNRDRANRKGRMLRTYGDGKVVACFWCNELQTFDTVTADRLIPGGTYGIENVIPTCVTCNTSRQDKSVEEFVEIAINPVLARMFLFIGALI